MAKVTERIARHEVHRLVVVDDENFFTFIYFVVMITAMTAPTIYILIKLHAHKKSILAKIQRQNETFLFKKTPLAAEEDMQKLVLLVALFFCGSHLLLSNPSFFQKNQQWACFYS